MGRTVLPMMMVIEREQARWVKFRRALRKEDQEVLDELFLRARRHVQAASYASDALPFEVMLLSMLLELQKQLRRDRSISADSPIESFDGSSVR